jgi:hypothetical protein
MAQFFVLLVTGLAIYRQLRAQGSANALQAQGPSSPAGNLRRWCRAAGVPDRRCQRRDTVPGRDGRVSRELLRRDGGSRRAIRARNAGIYGEFEALAATMAKLDEKHRVPNFVVEDVGPRIDREIRRLVRRLRLERDARDGLVPTWPVVDKPRPEATEQPSEGQGRRPTRSSA